MEEEGTKSLDQTIVALIEKRKNVPKSLFGIDKSVTRKLKLTLKDHEEFQHSFLPFS